MPSLITCPVCGHYPLAAHAQACPKCGAPGPGTQPHRADAVYLTNPSIRVRPTTSPVTWGCAGLLGFGMLIVIIGLVFDSGPGQAGRKGESSFTVVREWEIPNGGRGQVLLVDHRAAEDVAELLAIGSKIIAEHRGGRNAYVEVFDDAAAAATDELAVMDARAQEWAFYARHKVLSYNKNGNTGHHELVLMPQGLDSTWIKVDPDTLR
jgi:hypothetical protein